MSKQYKVDFYQTVYLGSQLVDAKDEHEAKSEAMNMNYKAGIGLKWADDWEAEIDDNHDFIFICTAHSKEECNDDECWEDYEAKLKEEE